MLGEVATLTKSEECTEDVAANQQHHPHRFQPWPLRHAGQGRRIRLRQGDGIPSVPPDDTPSQRLYRRTPNSLAEGATLDGAMEFRQIAKNPPRHNQ